MRAQDIRRLIDRYDDDNEAVEMEYRRRLRDIASRGKPSNADIMELNMWKVQRSNEIKCEFIDAIKEAERRTNGD